MCNQPSCPPCPGHPVTYTQYCTPGKPSRDWGGWVVGGILAAVAFLVIVGIFVAAGHTTDCCSGSGQQIVNYGGTQTVVENH